MKRSGAGWIVIWEFRPRRGREAEFREAYGPAGAWVALFGSAPGYLGSELVRDLDDPDRYLTIDRWTSREALESFRRIRDAEYRALDRVTESLTSSEIHLGDFTAGSVR